MRSMTFNGTGAAVYLGIGEADWAEVENLESATNHYRLRWDKNMRAAEMPEGILYTEVIAGGNLTATRQLIGQGIARYAGGDLAAAGNTAYLIPRKDYPSLDHDQRSANVVNGALPITTWTRDTAQNGTTAAQGHWNAEANTTYVGEGSVVVIRETSTNLRKMAFIVAMASNGEAANETDLSVDIKSGVVEYIGPMYDLVAAPSGFVMPRGLVLSNTTINASGEICKVTWGKYDPPALQG